MSNSTPPTSSPGFGQRLEIALHVFFKGLLRLLILVMVIGLVGLGIYYGLPYLYQQFILPVQINTNQLSIVKTQQASSEQAARLQIEQLQTRLLTLENQHGVDQETISEIQTRLDAGEKTLQETTASLKKLDDLQSQIDQIQQKASMNASRVTAMEEQLSANDAPLAALEREVILVKAMELLNRSRLYLLQNNAGLAAGDVQAARGLLASLQDTTPEEEKPALTALLARVDLALSSLPFSPVIAADDLEIAWRLLVQGLKPQPTPTLVEGLPFPATPTPTELPTATVTPAAGLVTPTPTAVISTPTLTSTAARTATSQP